MSLIPPVHAAAPLQRAVPASSTTTAPRRALLRAGWRLLLALVGLAWGVTLVVWLTIHWAILPHIQQWRGLLETHASRAVGVPVGIGRIEARSGGWLPSLELRDVVLHDRRGNQALRLPRVAAVPSWRSLLSLELRFEQLLIDGAELDIRRDAAGRISIAGLDFGGAAPAGGDDRDAASWFFRQREFVIRGGALRWTDEQRGAPPLALTGVQLVVRNRLLHHDIRLDATPPAVWGDRFSLVGRFTQPLLAEPGDWRRWSGSAYASLPRADVRELRRHLALPFELSEGDGALRGWFELKDGQPTAATLDVALRAVTLRLNPKVEALGVERVQGRLLVERQADGVFKLAARRLSFRTADDDVRWPEGDLSLAWRQRDGEPASGGEFSAQRLDVGLMAQIASRVPLGEALRRLLGQLDPKGVISDLAASWDGPLDALRRYRVSGALSGLTLAPQPADDPEAIGRPGLRNAGVRLDATEAGGQATLTIADGALDLPGVFEDAVLPLERFSAELSWKIEAAGATGADASASAATAGPKLTVQARGVRFANADARGELSATWQTGPGSGVGRDGRYPGRLELDGTLGDAVAVRTARYLPLGLNRDVRDYLQRAVRGGTLPSASFRVNGRLWDFPFANARTARDGEFRIGARLAGVSFAYVPDAPARGAQPARVSPWPALTDIHGELLIDRQTLEIRNARGRLGGTAWSRVQGRIRNLDDAVLTLDASGRGPLAEMLEFVNATPVGPWTGNALARASATGPADIKLALRVPLADTDATGVDGSITLVGNDVRITPGSPLLAGTRGRVGFTGQSLSVSGASARVFGGDTTFEGGTQADGSLRFSGQGVASADGLRRAGTESAELARLAGALSGQAAYRVNLGFVGDQSEIDVTSNLVGLGVNLPAPLGKAADAALALHYRTVLAPESLAAGQTPRDTLRLELGTLLQAQYQRDLSGAAPRVLRGGVGVMEPAPLPASGVKAHVNVRTLDVDAWQAAADKLLGSRDSNVNSNNTNEARPGGGSGVPAGPNPAAGYAPDTWALRAQELTAGARRLDKLTAGVSRSGEVWRASLDATQLAGYVEYRPPNAGSGAGAGRVMARLSRLSLPKDEGQRQVETLLDQQPASVPGLDIVVDDFELRGKRLGRLEIEAVNRGGGGGGGGSGAETRDVAHEWQLSKFRLTTPEAQFDATGKWAAGGNGAPVGQRRSVMDFKLAVADSGALLERLGTPQAIRGGKGALSGRVSWLGSPLALDHPSLGGELRLALDKGQFLKAEPGAARLLGVLSLQALPRRLSLDFRDLFEDGFAFDNITADVTIASGEARTNNFRMRGVQAVVLIDGRADIARETQDLRVWVVPEINAGTASLAYAVINPAIGLGTFLAQVVLRKPLIQAGTREFRVHGPWSDPKVDPVARKMSDAVPPIDPPAAAATDAQAATEAAGAASASASASAPAMTPALTPALSPSTLSR